MKKIFLVCLMAMLIVISGPCLAKEIDVSATPFIGPDCGSWGSGAVPSPTGTMKEWAATYGASVQVKYHGWIFKTWQPTGEFSYRHAEYDFSNWQASTQEANPDYFSLRVGLTKEFEWASVYGLVGISFVHNNIELVERIPPADHGKRRWADEYLSFKVGAYKLWNVGPIKVGPEVSCDIFAQRPKHERCRTFRTNQFVPFVGLRLQY